MAVTTMSGTGEMRVDSPAAYGGGPDALNPEEMFVASINSCLMLVFYHFANQRQVDIASYRSTAAGKVEKTPNGLRFTEVNVKATVSLGDQERIGEVARLAELAEKYCLVSNSVACPVHYEVAIA